VLLPSDAHRKPVISITVVLFPFVTYLLTLPRINGISCIYGETVISKCPSGDIMRMCGCNSLEALEGHFDITTSLNVRAVNLRRSEK
jgi:hypothetical protein